MVLAFRRRLLDFQGSGGGRGARRHREEGGEGAGGEGWGQICLMTSAQNEFKKQKKNKIRWFVWKWQQFTNVLNDQVILVLICVWCFFSSWRPSPNLFDQPPLVKSFRNYWKAAPSLKGAPLFLIIIENGPHEEENVGVSLKPLKNH